MLLRNEIGQQKNQQDQILYEGLQVGQVDHLAKAAAVHLWVEYEQNQSDQCEENLHSEGGPRDDPSPYSGNEGYADHCLGKGE